MPTTNIKVDLANLANMDATTKEIVGKFLDQHKDIPYISSKFRYPFVNSTGRYVTLTFSNDFFQRKSKKGVIKYEVIDNDILGSGGFGEIRKLIASFVLLRNASSNTTIDPLNKKKPHLVKIQQHDPLRNPYSNAEMEYKSTTIDAEATYISMKPPIKVNGPTGEMSLLVIRELPGYDVQDLIDAKYPDNIDDALALCLAMAKSIRDQVHSKDVAHRDIKPANLMALHDKNKWIVNTIDFALSRLTKTKQHKDFRAVGSPGFFAPEILETKAVPPKTLSKKSDISSLGMLFGIILGAKDPREEIEEDEKKTGVFNPFFHIMKIKKTGYYEFIDLFSKLKQNPPLTPEHETQIQKLLDDMTALLKKSRPDINGVVSRLEDIVAKRQLLLSPPLSPTIPSNP